MRWPSAYSLAMSTTVRRRMVSDVALMLAPAAGSVVPPVCAAASRSSSAAATRSSSASATARLLCSGRSARDPSAARIDTRLVSVPKPEPGSATSFATSRSTPLRRSLSAARSSEPVSAANPTRTGTGCERLARGGAVAVEAVGDPGDLGEEVRASPPARRVRSSRRAGACVSAAATGRKSATAAAMTRASKPAAPAGPWVRRSSAARRSAVDSTRTTRRRGRQVDLDVRRRRPSPARRGRARPRRSPRPSGRSSDCR